MLIIIKSKKKAKEANYIFCPKIVVNKERKEKSLITTIWKEKRKKLTFAREKNNHIFLMS